MHNIFKLVEVEDQEKEKEVSSITNKKTRQCEKTIGCTYTY